MLETEQIIYGIVAPLLIAVIAILPGCLIKPKEDGRDRFTWRIPLGLGAAVIVSFFGLHGFPKEDWQYALYLPVAGIVTGCVLASTKRNRPTRTVVFMILAIVSTIIIWPVLEREAIGYKLAPIFGVLILLLLLEPLVTRKSGPILLFAFMIATGSSAGVVLLSGHMDLAIPYGGMTLGLFVLSLLALWKRNLTLADGGLAVIVPLMVTIPLIRWLYLLSEGTDVPVIAFVLPIVAPLVLWLGEINNLRKKSVVLSEAVRLIPLVLICVVAVYLAKYPPGAEDGMGDDPYADMYEEMMSGE